MRGLTPVRAIRAKCIDCSGGQLKEVTECKKKSCKNWPYRHGKRPKPGSAEERVHVARGKLNVFELADVGTVLAALRASGVA